MKKLIRIFTPFVAVALLAAGCETSDNDTTSTPVVESEGITIAVSGVTDTSFDVTLTPKGVAAYYSYLVEEAESADASYTAADIYEVAVKGGVASGTIKYTSDSTYTKMTVSELDPNTSYCVYAVAGSTEGVPSEMMTYVVTTTDGDAPTFSEAGYSAKSQLLGMFFSEDVVAGAGEVTVKLYAFNLLYGSTTATNTPTSTITLDVANAIVEEDGVYFTGVDIPGGAMVAFSYPDGFVTDKKGNPITGVDGYWVFKGEQKGVKGPYLWLNNVSWEMAGFEADTVQTTDSYVYLDLGMPEGAGYELAGIDNTKTINVTYTSDSRTITYKNLAYGEAWGYVSSVGKPCFVFPAEPEQDDVITVSFPEKVFYDGWNNSNAAGEFSFVYHDKLAWVLGKYKIDCDFTSDVADEDNTFTLVRSDKDTYQKWSGSEGKYLNYPVNVMTSTWFGVRSTAYPMYGYYEEGSDTMTWYMATSGEYRVTSNDLYYYYYLPWGDTFLTLTIDVLGPGQLGKANDDFGFVRYDWGSGDIGKLSYYISGSDFAATRIE